MLFSGLNGKKVYVIEGAGLAGEICGVYISKKTKKLKYLAIGDVLSNEIVSIFAYDKIFGNGDFITVKNLNHLFLEPPNVNSYIFLKLNANVIDATGQYMGILEDINFAENEEVLKTDLMEIKLEDIISS